MKKMNRNHQMLKILIVHVLYPLKFNSHTLLFYKIFAIAWCDKYDLSIFCLLYFIKSLLNRVPCVPACQRDLRAKVLACQRGLRANVLACQRGLRANVPACQRAKFSYLRVNVPKNVPTCHKACQCFNLACQRANRCASFSTWRANVPKSVPIFQTFLLRNAKGNFYTLLYKKSYIILDIILIIILVLYYTFWNFFAR